MPNLPSLKPREIAKLRAIIREAQLTLDDIAKFLKN